MTEHALKRLAERLPGHDPAHALTELKARIASGRAERFCETVTGEGVWRAAFPAGTIYAIERAGDIVTVLTPGMTVTTPTGPVQLPEMPRLGAGLHRLEADRYHDDPCATPSLSSSIARKLLRQSPAHAWHASPRLNPHWQPVEKAHFDVGRAAHRAVLGAGADYVEIPDSMLASNGAVSTKAAKAFVEDARAAGLTPIKTEVAGHIRAMATICRDRLARVGLVLDPDHSEVAALAEIDGAWCRCMADNAPTRRLGSFGKVLVDFKTTTDANPGAVERAIMTYGYDLQAAHYRETWRAATGETRAFIFVFQEKEPPYEVAIVTLDGEAMEMGGRQARDARALWRDCLEAGDWPGYGAGVHHISLPTYYTARVLERESQMEDARQAASRAALERAQDWQSPLTMDGASA